MLKIIAEQLHQSDKPIFKVLFRNNHTRIVGFGVKKGMKLVDHQLPVCTKIAIIEGCLVIDSKIEVITLHKFDTYTMPKKVIHQVRVLEDTIALLILDFNE